MFIGHFGAGFAAKRFAPDVSLGTGILAALWIDLLWPTFLQLGWEKVRLQAGATAVAPLVFESYPFTHSLVAAALWGLLLAVIYGCTGKTLRGAIVVGVLVTSHWFLDAVVHVPDLPITPSGSTMVGLGLWNSKAATLAVEMPIFAIGAWFYAKASWAALDDVGRWAFIGLSTFLVIANTATVLGAAPPNEAALAWVGQTAWIIVAWGYWVDSRVGRRPSPPV